MSIEMPPVAEPVYTIPPAIIQPVSTSNENTRILHVNRHYRGNSKAPFADHDIGGQEVQGLKSYDGSGAFMGDSYITLSFDLDTDGLKSFSTDGSNPTNLETILTAENDDASVIDDLFAGHRDYHLALDIVGYRGKMNTSFEQTPQYREGSIVQERNMPLYSNDK